MRFFDLHCDTIGECSNNNLSLRNNNLHIDLERAQSIGEYTQVFAIWIPDELRSQDAVEYFDKTADCFYSEIEKNNDLISLCTVMEFRLFTNFVKSLSSVISSDK